jgi:hypothetical protein
MPPLLDAVLSFSARDAPARAHTPFSINRSNNN